MAYKRHQTPLTPEQAVQYALRLLSERAYSVAKLSQKLAQHQLPQAEIDAIVSKLIDLGLLNDQRYAQSLARQEIELSQKSRWWTKQKLISKGIDSEIINLVMDEAAQQSSENNQIDYHIAKHLKRYGQPSSHNDRQKIIAKLARRGFKPGQVISRLNELKNADLPQEENLLE